MSSTDTPTDESEAAEGSAPDTVREAMLEQLTGELGDALAGSHLEPGIDLTVRVTAAALTRVADAVAVGVGLIRIGDEVAVVIQVTDGVTVGVDRRPDDLGI